MLTIAFHEFGHAATGCCTGAKVKSIELDPREGGVTMMAGGVGWITLPAGYLGSSLIGAVLIFCGFNVVASKIASLVVGVCFLITLWWSRRDWCVRPSRRSTRLPPPPAPPNFPQRPSLTP